MGIRSFHIFRGLELTGSQRGAACIMTLSHPFNQIKIYGISLPDFRFYSIQFIPIIINGKFTFDSKQQKGNEEGLLLNLNWSS